jgi:HSP20 family protein
MMTMQRDMNRLFSSLGMPLYGSKGDGERVAWMPTVDVLKQGDDLVVRAELPGVKAEDIDVSVSDDVLAIRGVRREEREQREGSYLRKESSFGSFERQVVVPQGTDPNSISADYTDGVLKVVVPHAARTAEPRTHRIDVRHQGGGQLESGQSAQTRLGGQQQGTGGGERQPSRVGTQSGAQDVHRENEEPQGPYDQAT